MKSDARIGRYEILDELGSGGMGVLLRARDPKLGREVAIKLLSDRLSTSSEHRLRFEQEAHAASLLGHPNIVTIYEIGDHGGLPFIAMELVAGRTLRAVMNEGFPTMRNLAAVAAQMAHGLAAAHERGITHRDLKPENVMVTAHGLVKILDFGLAKLIQEPIDESQTTADYQIATQPGRVLGTVGYMSPEQARGLRVDYRSDQFSLGSILYEMLTGYRPFRGATPLDALTAVLREEPPDLAGVNPRAPEPLRWVVARCLAKNPEERYAATLDLAQELDSIRDHIGEAGTVTAWTHPRTAVDARRSWLLAAGGLAIVAVGVTLVALLAGGKDIPPRGPGIATQAKTQRIAVLPFRDLTGTDRGELVGEGFAETVSARLSETGALAALPTQALQAAAAESLQQALALGAEIVLSGSLQFEGDRVRATYSLIAANGRQILAASSEGTAGHLLELQDEVAGRAALALGLSVARASSTAPSPGLDQDRFLEALGHLRRYENLASVEAAIEILEGLPESGAVTSALARAYLEKRTITGDPIWGERAIASSRRAVGLGPALGRVRETQGRVELLVGRPEAAEREFERALAAQPASVEAQLGLAQALDAKQEDRLAEVAYRRAVELQPGWWSTHSHLGVFFLRHGRFEEAAQSLREAIRLSPDNTRAIDNLAISYHYLGRYEEAVQEYERSIAIRPTSETLSNLGTLQFESGAFAAAAAAYRRAVAMQPKKGVLWLNLGDALRWARADAIGLADGEARAAYRSAIELLTADLELAPRNEDTLCSLALALARIGKRDEAMHHASLALEIAPESPFVLRDIALVRLATGDIDGALQLVEIAVTHGYPVDLIRRDPELAGMRSDPRLLRVLSIP